ncbi:hypothetical protein OHU34_43915 (plasmid) [Streptomyces sp. NBC_00080]|uniref:hypothetical protein n=1 Tax=Streptomyces sp. NBC_00080 TaxID=2975645 RepID=UPI002F91AFAB
MRQQDDLAVQVRGEPASLVQDPGDSDGPVRQGVKDRGVNHVLAGRVARRQRKGQHVHGTDAPGTPEAVLGLHLTDQRFELDQIVLESAANRDGMALQQPVRRREQGHLSTHCRRTDPLVVHDEGGALEDSVMTARTFLYRHRDLLDTLHAAAREPSASHTGRAPQ